MPSIRKALALSFAGKYSSLAIHTVAVMVLARLLTPAEIGVYSVGAAVVALAHDRRHDRLSPGTVLTMHMVERVIDADRAAEIDFGVGDDPYKRQWATERRERWGSVAFEPRAVRGALGAIRHLGGSKAKHPAAKLVSTGPQR